MNIPQKKIGLLLLMAGMLAGNICLAQFPVVKAAVDKSEILIGEQIKLRVEANFSNGGYKPVLPMFPDSAAHFEVLDKSKIDSVFTDGQLTAIIQNFTITSFDSGKWVLPPVKINFSPTGNNSAIAVYTDSLPITVSFSLSDTSSALKDIKPIKEAATITTIWYWIGAGLLLLSLIIFLIWFYRHWKKSKANVIFKAKLSPYDEAMQELQNLNKYNLSMPEEIKIYHSKLSEILKRYLSRKDNILYLNKTTGDVLLLINQRIADKELFTKLASSLRCGDAVKFAKFIPEENESRDCMQPVKELIVSFNQNTAAKPQ